MMNKKRLARAIAMAMTGTALTAGAISSAEAHTMYNTAIRVGAARQTGTDGWVYGSVDNGPSYNWSYPTPVDGWVGTGSGISSDLPFGYSGKAHLNWAAELHNTGDSLEISKADALTRYGSSISDVEIDTGAGAWQDASTTPTGWKHQTDIGLVKAEETMWVTLNPEVVPGTGSSAFVGNFGITVFAGMDTNAGVYSHHGRWNCPTCTDSNYKPYDLNDPFGTTGLTYLTHDGTVDAVNGLTFLAQAGQVYSIYLGGAGVGTWSTNVADYKLNITTSAVPVPAAVWLFGSALAGMGIIGRRKDRAVATA